MASNIIKSQEELSKMIKAAQIIDDAYDAVLAFIKEGYTEKEVAAFIEGFVKGAGGSGLSFETIVAYGESGAEPHHVPTDKKLEKGMLVTIDMGAVYEGYCSDFTRTFAFGKINDKQREIYEIVRESQRLGVESVESGKGGREVDAVCRDYIEAKGYGKQFIHTTGHGVGTEVHEAPKVSRLSTDILEDNMVITIEPGIYIEGEMGVRIEDMCIVGRKGALSRHSTALLTIDE